MAKENKFRLRDLFNLFDIVVLLIAVLMGVILVLFSRGTKSADITVRYTVEFTEMQNGTANLIKVGDKLVDRVKQLDLGEVISVEVEDTVHQVQDFEQGGIRETRSATRQTAIAVIEAPAAETERDFLVSGGFLIKIGIGVSAKGPGYAAYGNILAIEVVEGGEGK